MTEHNWIFQSHYNYYIYASNYNNHDHYVAIHVSAKTYERSKVKSPPLI